MSHLRVAITGLLLLVAALRAADETPIVLRDYTGRGFPPQVVTYSVPAGAAAKLRVVNAVGEPVPVQVTAPITAGGPASLSFIAALPANGTTRYALQRDAASAVPASAVAALAEGGALVLSNGALAVRVPAVQSLVFMNPVAASTLPAPVLAFRGADGAWRGAAKVLATRPVKGFVVTQLASGPVYAATRYELQFAGGGYYRATVRVTDQVPLVQVSEEYDPGVMDGTDSWELDLAAGWQPDRMEVARTNGNGGVDPGHVEPLEKLKDKSPSYLVPDSAWGAPWSQLGLFNEAAQKATPGSYPMAGIVPLHKGDWRHMNALEIQSTGAADVRVRFPMSRRYASWLREVTSETSPFSMQEHEMGQPPSYGRRHWGLVLAPTPAPYVTKTEGGKECGPFYQARLFYGVVGLDRYKDYVLDWPVGTVSYPCLYLKPDEVAAHKAALEAAPLPADFKAKLLAGTIALGADAATTEKRVKGVLYSLGYANTAVFISPTTGHHWSAPLYLTAAAADDVLSWADLPAATRAEIRARLALLCYTWEDADIMSYGDGSHPGNPNMGTARTSSMSTFLALLPNHPMASAWRAHMIAYLLYKGQEQTAPGGGYFEYGSAYHMHGYARITNAIPGAIAAGATAAEQDALFAFHRATWDYYLNLLTPVDSRWKTRVIPGLANSPPGYTEHFIEAAGTLASRDPALAANLEWAWLANGANDRNDPLGSMNGILAPAALAPVEPQLGSRIYPGVGVVFRAHQGPEETYMLFRSGYNWSHWYIDQGHFILMSRGATLVPFQPYQYWSTPNKEYDLYNTLRFGHPENNYPHAWPDSNIFDHAFGQSVDYAWSSTGFPDWFISPGASPDFGGKVDAPVGSGSARKLAEGSEQKPGAFEWQRQILFLKGRSAQSPNYFVLRDQTTGAGQLASYLYLNLLGKQTGVTVDGGKLAVATEWPVQLDVRFAQLGAVKPDFFEERQPVALAGYSGPTWWRKELAGPVSPNWTDKDGKPVPEATYKVNGGGGFWEQHTLLRVAGAPGAGYEWLLYPRTATEPEPQVTRLAPGVLKIVHPEGTDYTFLSTEPLTFTGEGIGFTGCAGAARVAKDGTITLALTGGTGKVSCLGHSLAGRAPLEETYAPGPATVAESMTRPAFAVPARLDDARTLAPGVQLAEKGTLRSYLVNPADGRVSGQFEHDVAVTADGPALVTVDGKTVRFVVAERSYVKLSVGNVGVRGLGPFDLTFTSTGISGQVAGDTRTLVTTWPADIVRPMYQLDGQRWYAGWADDHSISKGTAAPQFALALGVTDGPHAVSISEWVYPPLPPTPARLELK